LFVWLLHANIHANQAHDFSSPIMEDITGSADSSLACVSNNSINNDNTTNVIDNNAGANNSSAHAVRYERKRKTLDDTVSHEEFLKTWTQCHYFMKNKSRFCNVGPVPGSLYCGVHRPAEEGPSNTLTRKFARRSGGEQKSGNHSSSSSSADAGTTDMDPMNTNSNVSGESEAAGVCGLSTERIPCPVDPTHSIYKYNLHSHVKICNITSRNKLLSQQPFYRQDCNSGPAVDLATSNADNADNVDARALWDKIVRFYETTFGTSTYNFANPEYSIEIPHGKEIDDNVLDAVAKDQTAEDKLRHAMQDSLLVKQMIQHDLLEFHSKDDNNDSKQNTGTAYVELGAGRGMLGMAVKAVATESNVVLVERSGSRRKADKLMREKEWNFYRARMDIRHCFVPNLPGVDMAVRN
jgi:hypothetical protein